MQGNVPLYESRRSVRTTLLYILYSQHDNEGDSRALCTDPLSLLRNPFILNRTFHPDTFIIDSDKQNF